MEPEINPFSSPLTVSDPSVAGVGQDQRYAIPFESGHNRAMWAIGLLGLTMFFDVVGAGSFYLQIDLIGSVKHGVPIDRAAADSNDQRQGLIGMVQFAVFVGTAIAFLMWFHRARRNLPALGARGLTYSPRWAVGGFFVPFLNLVRPFQVMKEVWRGSDPHPSTIGTRRLDAVPLSPLVGWWWTLWIIMGVAGQVSFRLALSAKTIDEMLAASWAGMFSDFISLPAALVTIFMIRGVDFNQQWRNQAVNNPGGGTLAGSDWSYR